MSLPPFKIDEDLPAEIAGLVRGVGHDAATMADQRMLGWPDDRLWVEVAAEGRSLITADVGFADARRVAASPHVGIVLLRLAEESRRGYIRLFTDFLSGFSLERVPGCVVTVTDNAIRVHDTRRAT